MTSVVMNQLHVAAARLAVLDGWRGLCIVFVLAAHLLPLGPNSWELNLVAGIFGMSIFFVLSGFLITTFLLAHSSLVNFLIRRFFRIIPLAWLYIGVVSLLTQENESFWIANFLFYANWPPMALEDLNGHLWSLCVEMQFYIGIALLVLLFRKKWIFIVPIICMGITAYRALNGAYANVNTYYRVDEILAGSVLALVYENHLSHQLREKLGSVNQFLLLVLLVVSCHPGSGLLNYFRPYFAAILIGSTLSNGETVISRTLNNKILFYIATISYALYVVHPLLAHSWLGSGTGIEKYSKRPLLFAAIFLVAHLSTFYYEKWWMSLGRRLSRKINAQCRAV